MTISIVPKKCLVRADIHFRVILEQKSLTENLGLRNFLLKLCDLWLVAIFVAILEMHQILPQVHQGGSKLGLLPYLARPLEKIPIFSTAYGISYKSILQTSVNKGVIKCFHQK